MAAAALFLILPLGLLTVMVIMLTLDELASMGSGRKKKVKAAKPSAIAPPAPTAKELKVVPRALRKRLVELVAWNNSVLMRRDHVMATSLGGCLDLMGALFARLDAQNARQQARLAEVTYTPVLDKLKTLLSESYYLDILDNPTHWDDPQGRRSQVAEALTSVKDQLLENIKQVNAARDLEFQADLKILGSYRAQPTLGDIYPPE